jgi:hypothetical protein
MARGRASRCRHHGERVRRDCANRTYCAYCLTAIDDELLVLLRILQSLRSFSRRLRVRIETLGRFSTSPAEGSAFESAAEHFSQDVAWLNRNHPGWDDTMRVNGAMRRLRGGMPEEKVRAIFGAFVTQTACDRLTLESELPRKRDTPTRT